jgi:hypothetical protein
MDDTEGSLPCAYRRNTLLNIAFSCAFWACFVGVLF